MVQQQAQAVVAAPEAQVLQLLTDVGAWPSFISGLQTVEQSSHQRCVFTIEVGSRRYVVPMVVILRPAERRATWRSQVGPAWNGQIRWRPVDARHTSIELSTLRVPRGAMGHLAEFFGLGEHTAVFDLQRIEQLLRDRRDAAADVAHATAEGAAVAAAAERARSLTGPGLPVHRTLGLQAG